MATAPDLTRPAAPALPRWPVPGSDFSAWPAPAPPAAADVATELEEFRRYLDGQIARGVGNVSADALLSDFRQYQEALREVCEALRPGLERLDRGEDDSVEWDKEKILAEALRSLAAEGIEVGE